MIARLRAAFAAFLLLCGTAAAQTPGTFTPGPGLSMGKLNLSLGAKVDTNGGTLTNPTILGGASISGSLLLTTPTLPTQNTTYATGGLTNGVLIGAGGATISYCPVFACVLSPTADHQRAAMLLWGSTGVDNQAEENLFALEFIVNDGAFKTWAPNTRYSVGDNLAVFATNSGYRAVTAGVSASSGSGPVGKGSAIADGTVVWKWINDSTLFAKVGSYEEIMVNGPSPGHAGAGQTWGRAVNFGLQPGVIPSNDVAHEIDYSNNSGTDCVPGTNCVALAILMGGTNYSTSALSISRSAALPASYNPALFGINIADHVAIQAAIEVDDIGSMYGIAFGKFLTNSTHTVATIADASTSPTSIALSGAHSSQVFADTSVSPALINGAGSYALAAMRFTDATTPNVMLMKHGMNICFNDTDACFSYNLLGHKLVFAVGGAPKFSVSDSGAVVAAGPITANGSP